MTRSASGISAIFASTSFSPSALLARGPRRAAVLSSCARSFAAARSSAVNPEEGLAVFFSAIRGTSVCRTIPKGSRVAFRAGCSACCVAAVVLAVSAAAAQRAVACTAATTKALVRTFAADYSRGRVAAIDRMFAPEPYFQWFSSSAPGAGSAGRRTTARRSPRTSARGLARTADRSHQAFGQIRSEPQPRQLRRRASTQRRRRAGGPASVQRRSRLSSRRPVTHRLEHVTGDQIRR